MSKKPSSFAQQLQKTTQHIAREQTDTSSEVSDKDTFRQPEAEQLVQMNVRVTPELKEETRIYCRVTGMSHQELFSTALAEYMQRNPMNR